MHLFGSQVEYPNQKEDVRPTINNRRKKGGVRKG